MTHDAYLLHLIADDLMARRPDMAVVPILPSVKAGQFAPNKLV